MAVARFSTTQRLELVAAAAGLAAENAALARLHDVSARLVRQEALPTLLEAIVEAAIEVGGGQMGNVQLVDPASQELRMVAHRGFEQPFLDHFRVTRPAMAAACGEAVRHGQRVVVEDVRESDLFHGTPDLAMLEAAGVLACQSTPLIARDGRLLGVFSTHWTEPHRPDEGTLRILDLLAREASHLIEDRQREEALREADRRKDEFLAILSHELRNPLAAIKNALYVGDRATSAEQAQRARAVLDRQVAQLTRIVDDLLDVTRITQNKIRLERRVVDLDALARRTAEDHRPFFEERGVALDQPDAPAPVPVDGDESRLAQMLGNLLQNAAKFTPRGGVTHLAVQRDAAFGQAVLRVGDSGVGMTKGEMARLFQPFVQVDTTLDRSLGGLGLGLALVKGIVELHGGAVTVHSAGLGLGSEFVVRLPLAREALPAAEAPAPRAPRASRRVLVIEDNPDIAAMMREALELEAHHVVVAGDGPEGLRQARESRPDVVLCDIGLPGMSGYDVARALRADEALAGVRLVAVSGYGQPNDLALSAAAGFDRHLVKPAGLSQLTAILFSEDP
jgi:signal transduction histidine kinase/CheY-like chemotaxis protein